MASAKFELNEQNILGTSSPKFKTSTTKQTSIASLIENELKQLG